MTLHIIVFKADKAYGLNNYIIHIFDNEFKGYNYYINYASQLLQTNEVEFRYIGVEELPVDVGTGHYAFFFYKHRFENYRDVIKGTLDRSFFKILSVNDDSINKDVLKKYRENLLLIDYDVDYSSSKTEKFKFVRNFYENKPYFVRDEKFYNTPRGAHLRAILTRSLSFVDKLELREKLWDDERRLMFDAMLYKNGFEELTNILFNRKLYVKDWYGNYEEYSETPLLIDSFDVNIKLPTIETELFVVNGSVVSLKQPVTPERAYWLAKSIEDNLWEYQFYQEKIEDLKSRIIQTYIAVKPHLRKVLEECKISFSQGHVIIHVPEKYQQYVGAMIGKDGVIVKEVSNRVGVRIKISQDKVPEDVDLKNRLSELLRRVI